MDRSGTSVTFDNEPRQRSLDAALRGREEQDHVQQGHAPGGEREPGHGPRTSGRRGGMEAREGEAALLPEAGNDGTLRAAIPGSSTTPGGKTRVPWKRILPGDRVREGEDEGDDHARRSPALEPGRTRRGRRRKRSRGRSGRRCRTDRRGRRKGKSRRSWRRWRSS